MLHKKLLNMFNTEREILRDNRLARSLRTRLWMAGVFGKYYIYRAAYKLLEETYSSYISKFTYQKKLIEKLDFDILVILDACRADVFEEVVYGFLDGKFMPVRSPASVTIDWLIRTWGDRYWPNIHYVTASPMINKRGIIKEFDARKHFAYITEVWDRGWDPSLATVPPGNVNLAVRAAITRMKLRGLRLGRDYKLVVHYVQPHAPYLVFKKINEVIEKSGLAHEVADIALRREGRLVGKFAIDYVVLAVLKDKLGSTEKLNRMLRWAYVENLKWALRHVARLATSLDARIVITADHGELLGEYGLYFHMTLPLPQLRIVPWFRVK